MAELILKEEAYQIVGACFEVHNALGSGFLEAVYQEALEIELASQKVPFKPQFKFPVSYKGRKLESYYQADFFCYDQVIVEIKAVKELADTHRAQLINYLKATSLPLGLLINFGSQAKLEHQRIALTKKNH